MLKSLAIVLHVPASRAESSLSLRVSKAKFSKKNCLPLFWNFSYFLFPAQGRGGIGSEPRAIEE